MAKNTPEPFYDIAEIRVPTCNGTPVPKEENMEEKETAPDAAPAPAEQKLLPNFAPALLDPRQTKLKDYVPADLSVEEAVNVFRRNLIGWRRLYTYYNCAMLEVETKFKVLNEQFSLQYDRNPIEAIKTRVKSVESIAAKMMRKHLSPNLQSVEESISDVAGVRIICSFLDDIYLLADCLTEQDDITLLCTKDYIKHPKDNGYRGLHLIVEVPIFLQNEKRPMKVEVQFRTIAMDCWASLEHKLRYKKNLSENVVASVDEELQNCAALTAALDEKMQSIRQRIERENS